MSNYNCLNEGNTIPYAAYEFGICGKAFVREIVGYEPRGLFVTKEGYVLGLERNREKGIGRVVYYIDEDKDGEAEVSYVLATAPRLNHGLAVFEGYVYASSDTTVYRWLLSEARGSTEDESEIVINNMNADGTGGAPYGHTTRTIVFDEYGRLYVSVGSAGNVDEDSHRSRIRRFDITVLPEGGIDFQTGLVFADGLRNEVGLAFDSYGVLWGVENSADNLYRSDLGGDIHNDNPAEELNRFLESTVGQHWGYPYCWTEYNIPSTGLGTGTLWAWPGSIHDDYWCRNYTNSPVLAFQAHSAPLGIAFFRYSDDLPSYCPIHTSFPSNYDGDAFIAYHGSWNRDIPTGYKVVRIPMTNGMPTGDPPIDILWHAGSGAKWPNGLRPVDVKFDSCNRLLVSSDAGAPMILTLYYTPDITYSTEYFISSSHLMTTTTGILLTILSTLFHFLNK